MRRGPDGDDGTAARRRGLAATATVTLVAVVILSVAGTAGAATSASEPDRPRRVLVLSLPRTTWERLADTPTPRLRALLARSAVAALSPRTIGPVTDPGRAYATLGAGNRATTANPFTDGEAADADEDTPAGPAAAVFRRRTGIEPSGRVLALTFPAQVARNEQLLYGSRPGAFGGALVRSGLTAGVVGNAGQSIDDATRRQVALAAVDDTGQAAAGRVSADLLVEDDAAPFGVRSDPGRVLESVREVWASGATVAIVEFSDLERAEQARPQSTPAQGDRQFRQALRDADALAGELLATVDLQRDLVLVLGPTAPLEREQLTVFGLAGAGVPPGWARSSTTRRDAFVTLPDVAPTILRRLAVAVPSSMSDTPVSAVPAELPLAQRMEQMIRDNQRAVFRDEATGPLTVAFIVMLVVLLAVVAWTVGRRPSWSPAVRWACLVVMSVPVVMFLAGLLPYGRFTVATFGLVVLGGAAVVATVAVTAGRREDLLAPLVPAGLSVLVLTVDVATGAHLQINTMFGYSPIVAGRFAGFGNQAYAIFSIATLITATAVWDIWGRHRPDTPDRIRLGVVGAFFAAAVVVDGAPVLGSDVGGVLAMVPSYTLCLLMLAGRRIRARMVAAVGVATVGILAAFAAVDLARPPESRTHLGRFAQRLLDGDAAIILERKLQANLNQLTSTAWTVVIPAALAFFAYLTWRPNRRLAKVIERHPSFRTFGASAITLGVLSWAVNDSGVAIPAMMLTLALPYTAHLVLSTFLAPVPTGPAPGGRPRSASGSR